MFNSSDLKSLFGVTNELWNDWRWQMKQAIACGKGEFLRSVGIPAEDLNSGRVRSVTPYMVRLLMKLQSQNPEAFKAQYLQCIAVPNSTGDKWVWAKKKTSFMFKLPLPARLVTLFWGRGCQTQVEALENYYPKTDLVVVNSYCPVNCSFCLRGVGDSTGEASTLSGGMTGVFRAIKEIIRRGTPNVIISGGDPATLANKQLRQILDLLANAPSIKSIRIATRAVVHLPMRFDSELLTLFAEMAHKMRQRGGILRVVTHINHPAELTTEALTAIRNIQDCRVEILNQTVLLKGVNDNEELLQELFMLLDNLGVRPYKLFHDMPVTGTDLRVPLSRLKKLVAGLHQWIPGTAVPQSNVPTLIGKMPVGPAGRFMIPIPFTRRVLVRNWRREWYLYEDARDPKRRVWEFSLVSVIATMVMIFASMPVTTQKETQLPFDRVEYPQKELREQHGYLDAPMRKYFKPYISGRVLYLPEDQNGGDSVPY